MRWNQGREVIDRMLADRELQRVSASREQADRLIALAGKHLKSADRVCDVDPDGGYALLYDAARKALTAILENQGPRPTSRGGHLAVRAQLDPPMGAKLSPFDRMRRQRNVVEYLSGNVPPLTAADVREDFGKAELLAGLAAGVLDGMSPFRACRSLRSPAVLPRSSTWRSPRAQRIRKGGGCALSLATRGSPPTT